MFAFMGNLLLRALGWIPIELVFKATFPVVVTAYLIPRVLTQPVTAVPFLSGVVAACRTLQSNGPGIFNAYHSIATPLTLLLWWAACSSVVGALQGCILAGIVALVKAILAALWSVLKILVSATIAVVTAPIVACRGLVARIRRNGVDDEDAAENDSNELNKVETSAPATLVTAAATTSTAAESKDTLPVFVPAPAIANSMLSDESPPGVTAASVVAGVPAPDGDAQRPINSLYSVKRGRIPAANDKLNKNPDCVQAAATLIPDGCDKSLPHGLGFAAAAFRTGQVHSKSTFLAANTSFLPIGDKHQDYIAPPVDVSVFPDARQQLQVEPPVVAHAAAAQGAASFLSVGVEQRQRHSSQVTVRVAKCVALPPPNADEQIRKNSIDIVSEPIVAAANFLLPVVEAQGKSSEATTISRKRKASSSKSAPSPAPTAATKNNRRVSSDEDEDEDSLPARLSKRRCQVDCRQAPAAHAVLSSPKAFKTTDVKAPAGTRPIGQKEKESGVQQVLPTSRPTRKAPSKSAFITSTTHALKPPPEHSFNPASKKRNRQVMADEARDADAQPRKKRSTRM